MIYDSCLPGYILAAWPSEARRPGLLEQLYWYWGGLSTAMRNFSGSVNVGEEGNRWQVLHGRESQPGRRVRRPGWWMLG